MLQLELIDPFTSLADFSLKAKGITRYETALPRLDLAASGDCSRLPVLVPAGVSAFARASLHFKPEEAPLHRAGSTTARSLWRQTSIFQGARMG